MYICPHVCFCTMDVQCLRRSEEGVVFPGTAVADCSKPPYRSRELNPDPLKDQPVLLNTELPLQAHISVFTHLIEIPSEMNSL